MKIICILGKSGSGKSTVETQIEKAGYNRIISYTSREPRGNEKNGREYHFVTREDFEKLIQKGILMEYTEYSGNYYGAPKPVGSINNVIVVETVGYLKIKELYGNQAIGVYMKLPDEIVNERINKRNDTSQEEIEKRNMEDKRIFSGIEDKVDLIVDSSQPVDISVLQILNYAKERD